MMYGIILHWNWRASLAVLYTEAACSARVVFASRGKLAKLIEPILWADWRRKPRREPSRIEPISKPLRSPLVGHIFVVKAWMGKWAVGMCACMLSANCIHLQQSGDGKRYVRPFDYPSQKARIERSLPPLILKVLFRDKKLEISLQSLPRLVAKQILDLCLRVRKGCPRICNPGFLSKESWRENMRENAELWAWRYCAVS